MHELAIADETVADNERVPPRAIHASSHSCLERQGDWDRGCEALEKNVRNAW
jgi:hypothetical protein